MILGIDPGATTGWCLYDSLHRRVHASGLFPGADYATAGFLAAIQSASSIVLERPVAHGPTRPQVVECAWIAGLIAGRLHAEAVQTMTRLEVKQALTAATHGEVQVRNDSTAWAAVVLLHGGQAATKKGGSLHGVRSHARAALATCIAAHLTTSGFHPRRDMLYSPTACPDSKSPRAAPLKRTQPDRPAASRDGNSAR